VGTFQRALPCEESHEAGEKILRGKGARGPQVPGLGRGDEAGGSGLVINIPSRGGVVGRGYDGRIGGLIPDVIVRLTWGGILLC
jgi:hypothetical protein